MNSLPLAILAILAVSMPVQAFGQGKHRFFNHMDADGNGYLSRSEILRQFPDFQDEMFKQADTNRDGRLSVEEWQDFVRARRAEKGAKGV